MPVPIQVAIRAVLKRDYLGSKKVSGTNGTVEP